MVPADSPKDYVTDENYFYYKQDIERLAAMGVEYYSFSIPWTRIMPFILPGTPVNKQAIDHYNDLINTVLDAGMQPVVTMLHFDSPLIFVAGDNIGMHSFYLKQSSLFFTRSNLCSSTSRYWKCQCRVSE